jgi:hypothetical protein
MRSAHDDVAAIAAATARDRLLIAAHQGETMERPGDQLAALVDLGSALDAAGISYAVIGGVAVGIQSSSPRATNDIDAAVPTRHRDEAVTALIAAGFETTGTLEHSTNFKHLSGEPVEISFDPAFDAMIERAESVAVGDRVVRVVRRDDLIAMKERDLSDPGRRRSKALRDQADIALLRGDVEGPNEGW